MRFKLFITTKATFKNSYTMMNSFNKDKRKNR